MKKIYLLSLVFFLIISTSCAAKTEQQIIEKNDDVEQLRKRAEQGSQELKEINQ